MRIAIMSRKRSLYSTRRLIEEAESRKITPVVMNPLKTDIIVGKAGHYIYYNKRKIKNISAVIPRIGASTTRHGLNVLRQFVEMGVPSISNPEGIAIARDKFHCLQTMAKNGILVPKSILIRSLNNIEKAIDRVGGAPVIVKLIRGTQGVGVILIESKKSATSILEALWSLGQHIMIQEFIVESRGVDIRCMVVNGRVVASGKRIARIGEFRSNYHQGGVFETVDLSPGQKDIAVRAATSIGIDVAGIDMLESAKGLMVLEVNASPGFEGLESVTQVNVAGAILDYARELAEKKEGKKAPL
ncbi:RimK family alpha-L-glutamate ligase [candidate division KSB1 bacterium]